MFSFSRNTVDRLFEYIPELVPINASFQFNDQTVEAAETEMTVSSTAGSATFFITDDGSFTGSGPSESNLHQLILDELNGIRRPLYANGSSSS